MNEQFDEKAVERARRMSEKFREQRKQLRWTIAEAAAALETTPAMIKEMETLAVSGKVTKKRIENPLIPRAGLLMDFFANTDHRPEGWADEKDQRLDRFRAQHAQYMRDTSRRRRKKEEQETNEG